MRSSLHCLSVARKSQGKTKQDKEAEEEEEEEEERTNQPSRSGNQGSSNDRLPLCLIQFLKLEVVIR